MLQSIELPNGLTATKLIEKMGDLLGWETYSDTDTGSAVAWFDKEKTIGIRANNTAGTTISVCLRNQKAEANSGITVNANAINFIDVETSSKDTAVIVGFHTDGSAPFRDGSVIIGKKSNGNISGMQSNASTGTVVSELPAGNAASRSYNINTLAAEATCAETVIYKAPSLFGGVYEEVYSVWSCPAAGAYVRCTLDGRVFQMSNRSNARLAIEVGGNQNEG